MASFTGPSWQTFMQDQYGNTSPLGYGAIGGMPFGQAGGNMQANFLDAQNIGDAQVRQRMSGAVDAQGNILKEPKTQAEFTEVQRQLEKVGSAQAKANFARQASLLGFQSDGNFNINGGGGAGGGAAGGAPNIAGLKAASGAGGGGDYNGPQVDPQIEGGFRNTMTSALTNPGMSPATVAAMIDKGNEGLATARTDTARAARQSAAAAGMGGSGVEARAMTRLNEDTAGKQADNQRDIEIAAERERLQNRNSALNTAGGYLNSQQARQASWYQFLQEQSRNDRNNMVSLLGRQQPAVPQLVGGGYGANAGGVRGLGYGGGANSGTAIPNQPVQMTARTPNVQAPPPPPLGGGQAPVAPPVQPPKAPNEPPANNPFQPPPAQGGDAFSRTGATRGPAEPDWSKIPTYPMDGETQTMNSNAGARTASSTAAALPSLQPTARAQPQAGWTMPGGMGGASVSGNTATIQRGRRGGVVNPVAIPVGGYATAR